MTDRIRALAGLSRRELALCVVAVAVLVYANSVANGFALDDVWAIQSNPRVHDWTQLGRIWLTPYYYANGRAIGLYRPLTVFAFALEWALGAHGPTLFHLINVLLHAAVSAVVFLVLDALVPLRAAALFGALLFAVHPLHAEAVANSVGQAELLSTLAVLLAVLLHVRRAGPGVSYGRLLAILACYAAGLLAKENAVVLPALLVVADVCAGRVEVSRAGLRRYVGVMAFPLLMLAATAAGYLVLRLSVLGTLGGGRLTPGYVFLQEPRTRVLTALRAWAEYARLAFFPVHLSADYSPAALLPVTRPTPLMWVGAALLAGTTVLAASAPRYRRAGAGAAWFLIAVLPVSNLFFPVGVVVAERTLYLPSVGLAFLAAALWIRAADEVRSQTDPGRARRLAWTGIAVVVATLVPLAARTVLRNPVWRDNAVLMDTTLRETPESYRSQWHGAINAIENRDTAAALDLFALAHRLYPYDIELNTEYAETLLGVGRPKPAAALLSANLQQPVQPIRDLRLLPSALLQAGLDRQALAAAQRGIARTGDQSFEEARAYALLALGGVVPARDAAARAVRAHRAHPWTAWVLYARTLTATGDGADAVVALDSAAALAPDSLARRAVADARRELRPAR